MRLFTISTLVITSLMLSSCNKEVPSKIEQTEPISVESMVPTESNRVPNMATNKVLSKGIVYEVRNNTLYKDTEIVSLPFLLSGIDITILGDDTTYLLSTQGLVRYKPTGVYAPVNVDKIVRFAVSKNTLFYMTSENQVFSYNGIDFEPLPDADTKMFEILRHKLVYTSGSKLVTVDLLTDDIDIKYGTMSNYTVDESTRLTVVLDTGEVVQIQ